MTIYRVKQFLWAVTSSFKPIDKKILEKYLNNDEEKFFRKLSLSEQHHSIRVCKDALEMKKDKNIDNKKLAKIALLHDIGKISTRLTIIDKSIIVILDKVTKGRLEKYKNIKKIDMYYNHAKKSVDLLSSINKYDNEFLEAIEKHHYKNIDSNIYLKIIKECDDKN